MMKRSPSPYQQAVAAPQPARTPTAPGVYRPQPTPRVLQTKKKECWTTPPPVVQAQSRSLPPTAQHMRLAPTVLQPSMVSPQSRTGNSMAPQRNAPPNREVIRRAPVIQRAIVQPFKSGIVQATKFYPNLHPGAAVQVDRSNIFTLDSFADQYRLHRINSHAVNVPNMKYNFVRNREGQMLLHNRYRHPSLAEGQQVLYAGEIFFNNGKLEWWSNGSGHYQPDEDGAEQANLPMDYFYSYQQILKGEHARKT